MATNKKNNINTSTNRRSSKYENEKAIKHKHSRNTPNKNWNSSSNNKNNKINKRDNIKRKETNNIPRKKDKLDRTGWIFLGVVFFVFVIILLKTMGMVMTLITVVGMFLIILLAMFLKRVRRKRVVRIITNILMILILLGGFAVIGGIAYFGYIIVEDANPKWDTSKLTSKESTILYTADGKEYANLSTERREKISYSEISENLINAIIATEDSRFFDHNGFDPLRFFKAGLLQVSGDSEAGGASTLSMQVIKNNMTSKVATGIEGIKRKFSDIYLAVFKLEKEYTKEQIMEFYINLHYLGSNSYGVEEASHTYFGKSASDLNLSEAALLAGMYQSPNTYNPKTNPEAAAERRETVLKLMYNHGYITKEEKDAANAIPIKDLIINSNSSTFNSYQSYIDTVIDELENEWGIDPYNTSLAIYTNIDLKKQEGLDRIFNGSGFNWENGVVQAGIAAVDVHTGKITAVGGSRNNEARTLNRATTGKQQIGSTAKPIFDYGPGMEYEGWSTYTMFDDSPYHYSSGQPIRDSDRRYMGNITLRTALAQSRNIPALKAFQKGSNDKKYKCVTSLGITPETTEGSTYMHEAHSIGAFNGSNPLEMAAAYAAFANGGIYYKPYTINKIVYRDTGETVEYEAEGVQVMSSATAYMITYCLRYAVTDGLSKGASVPGIKVAAKTGTTNYTSEIAKKNNLPSYAVKDAWIIGYDTDTAVGMWYGYDKIYDGKKTNYYLKSVTSGFKVNVQTERNRLYVTAGKVLFTSNGKDFKVPNTVVRVAVEKGSNPAKLASSSTPSGKVTYEYFRKGTEPTEVSTAYSKLGNVTGLTATYDAATKNVRLSWKAAAKSNDADVTYGDFEYKIYKDNKYVTFTTNTYYNYTGSDSEGTYKVVTSYRNYSDIDSSGATAKIGVSETDTYSYTATAHIVEGSYDTDNKCLTKGANLTDCVTVTRSDGQVITSGYTVSLSIKDADGDEVTLDDGGTPKTITYTIRYHGKTFYAVVHGVKANE